MRHLKEQNHTVDERSVSHHVDVERRCAHLAAASKRVTLHTTPYPDHLDQAAGQVGHDVTTARGLGCNGVNLDGSWTTVRDNLRCNIEKLHEFNLDDVDRLADQCAIVGSRTLRPAPSRATDARSIG
jgi:hypothetical protein